MNAPSVPVGVALAERARRVAAVAAQHADAVDRDGRFPAEAVAAMKAERLMGVQVPVALGGEGATISEIAELCAILGQACSASAMTFAMHQIKVSSLVEHAVDSPFHAAFMRRLVDEQLLIASATTEGGIGGNMRNSLCAVEVEGGRVRLTKDATVISYGDMADAILITSRSHKDAPTTDQVMTLFLKGQYTLDRTVTWDTLGMRGTCSDGYLFKGEGAAEQVIPAPFAEIAAESMLANAHLLWGSLWYGIAVDAVARAQAFIRAAARRNPEAEPPGALHLARAVAELQTVKSVVASGLRAYEEARHDPDRLTTVAFSVAINNVKVAVSETILTIVDRAMLICGILGYKNGTPYSLGRHLRDVHSARLMISNDRILGNTSKLLLVNRPDTSLLG